MAASYQVIARKYRPMTFDEVIGQEHVTRTIRNSIALGRVGHAFLFSGPRGVGKTTTARILARALNCANGITADPCNTCEYCVEITEGRAFDVFEIDGASNRGIDEVREIKENSRYSPSKFRYKVFIIDEVHMLTKEAFNALLKTLEEPPDFVKFILATTEPHKLPVTILSRCQRYDFRFVALDVIFGALKEICQAEEVSISDTSLRLIARLAEGSVRDGESLLEQVIAFGGREVSDDQVALLSHRISFQALLPLVEGLAGGDSGRALDEFQRLVDAGCDIQQLAKELAEFLRDVLMVQVSKDPGRLVERPESELVSLAGVGKLTSADRLAQQLSLLSHAEPEIRRSSYPRLLFEITLIRLAKVAEVAPIEELLRSARSVMSAGAEGLPEAVYQPPAPQKNPIHPPPSPLPGGEEAITGGTPAPPDNIIPPPPNPLPGGEGVITGGTLAAPKQEPNNGKQQPVPEEEVSLPQYLVERFAQADLDEKGHILVQALEALRLKFLAAQLSDALFTEFSDHFARIALDEGTLKVLDLAKAEEAVRTALFQLCGQEFSVKFGQRTGEETGRTPTQIQREQDEARQLQLFEIAQKSPTFREALDVLHLKGKMPRYVEEVRLDTPSSTSDSSSDVAGDLPLPLEDSDVG